MTLWILLFYCCLVTDGDAYMVGAPRGVCLGMHAVHDYLPHRRTDNPFRITMAKDTYVPSEEIDLTLDSSDGRPFKGFMIVAHRTSGNQEEAIGTMVKYPMDKAKTDGCVYEKPNVLTHKNNDSVTAVHFTWNAPNQNNGNITFRYMVVVDFETFWFGRDSSVLASAAEAAATTTGKQTKPRNDVATIDWSACGRTKGCFLHPRLCTGSDCKAAFTYRPEGDQFVFELFTSGNAYISVGFSEDTKMTDDHVHLCLATEGKLSVQNGYNPNRYYVRTYNEAKLANMTIWLENGNTACRFSRPRAMVVTDMNVNRIFDLARSYYLMLAWGRAYPTTEMPYFHEELPVVSESLVSLREMKITRGSSLPILTQVHGALMLIAWIPLAGLTTVIPRHYKDLLADRLICGLKPWFQIHRACASLVWLSTAASFVIIFVHVQGLSQTARNHAICGIAVMAGCTIQAVLGIARPGPESKLRPLFNIGHLLLGKSCHILAAGCVVLVYYEKIFTEEQRMFGLIVTFVWIGWQVLVEIMMDCRMCSKRQRTTKKYDVGKTKEISNTNVNCSDICFLLLYVTSLCALLAAALCAILLY